MLDGLRLGYSVVVPSTATRAVNVSPGDDERAVAEIRAAGTQIVP